MSFAGRAAVFAAQAHETQQRKYTGAPYIVHPAEVAQLVAEYGDVPESLKDEVIAAAFLHDVVEDTPFTLSDIQLRFGKNVSRFVDELTERVWGPGNRAQRKAKEAERLSTIGYCAREIKLADLISNTMDIVKNDPKFAVVYLSEKYDVLNALDRGPENRSVLYRKAWEVFYNAIDQLEAMGVDTKAGRKAKEELEVVD